MGELSGLPHHLVVTSTSSTNGLGSARGLDTTLASNTSASTSGILGGNGSILERSLSPSQQLESGSSVLFTNDQDEEDEDTLSDESSSSTSVSWTLIDRMRTWRNDALNQHLYSTAIYWGSKAFTRTRDPHDGFWLAQSYFAAGMYSRAERVLVGSWEVKDLEGYEIGGAERRRDKGKARQASEEEGMNLDDAASSLVSHPNGEEQREDLRSSTTERERECTHQPTAVLSQASTLRIKPFQPPSHSSQRQETIKDVPVIRLAEISVACRYLAAQALIRQEKWAAAMELLGEVNPFKGLRSGKKGTRTGTSTSTSNREAGDGGIKVGHSCSVLFLFVLSEVLRLMIASVRSIHVPSPRPSPATSQRQ